MAKAKSKTDKIRLRLRCKPNELDYSALQWYPDATRLIRELYGDQWKLFVDLLASTSPRMYVKKNWRLATGIMHAYINRKRRPDVFGVALQALMPAHLVNVLRSLRGKPIHGPKVSRFAANLKGDLSVVTIDVWICQAYGIKHKGLTPKLYDRLERKIKRDAVACKATPAGYQAVLWYAVRRQAGLRDRSFIQVYHEIFCETPFFSFMEV